jgi:hypothetical protein
MPSYSHSPRPAATTRPIPQSICITLLVVLVVVVFASVKLTPSTMPARRREAPDVGCAPMTSPSVGVGSKKTLVAGAVAVTVIVLDHAAN